MANDPTQLGGEEHFAVSQERVYALVTDLDAMAAAMPDLVSAERVDERTLKCVVRPGFSFLRGTMRLAITLLECEKPARAAMNVDAQGIGLSMRVASQLQIASEGNGSRLEWTAQIDELKGLISAVSPGLIKAAAEQVIRHAWGEVRRQLDEG
ncbi:MAG: SRPBCC domain-containing protein [Pirellulales bacterium]